MKKITVEERIFNLLEPALNHYSGGKQGYYRTADGVKSKVGLLTHIRKIVDSGAKVVELPVEGKVE